MKNHIIRLVLALFLLWPSHLIQAEEPSYTIQDLEGEYDYALLASGSLEADQRIPVESKDPQELLDHILKAIYDLKTDPLYSRGLASGLYRLKEDFEASYLVKDKKFIWVSMMEGEDDITQDFIKPDQARTVPLFELKPASGLKDYEYLVLDHQELYYFTLSDYKADGQMIDLKVLGKKDHPILNNQISESLLKPFMTEGYGIDASGYRIIPYSDLLSQEDFEHQDVMVEGEITQMILAEEYGYEFTIAADNGSEKYSVNWNYEPDLNLALTEGDHVIIRGSYLGVKEEVETGETLPHLLVGSPYQSVEKVE